MYPTSKHGRCPDYIYMYMYEMLQLYNYPIMKIYIYVELTQAS